MKRQLSFTVLAALGAFALVLLAGVPLPYPAQAQASPSVAVSLSSDTVEEGEEIAVTMSFSGLESDADTATKDYVFRADVLDSEKGDADACEDQANGYGLGVDRYVYMVDEDLETRTGSISADCPAGQYTVRASISDANDAELASDSADFSVVEPPSTDAALSGLALSGVDIGTFDPATYSYDVNVGHEVAETTVTATTNDGGATYVIRVDGVEDGDGTVPLAEGNNLIAVEVTAEDGETTRTYTATVTRAEGSSSDNPVPPSDDATLKSLELSGIAFAFDPATYSYDLSVGYEVERTAITAATNHAGATYDVAMVLAGGYEDGMVTLDEGANTIVLLVEAEDRETLQTYTVIVTRAAAPTGDSDPTPEPSPTPEKEEASDEGQVSVFVALSLFPSNSVGPETAIEVTMGFIGLEQDFDRDTTDYIFRADVRDSEGGDADACEDQANGYGLGVDRYVYMVDEDMETRTGSISADCPAGDYTLEVSVSSPGDVLLASQSAGFTIVGDAPLNAAEQQSTPSGSDLHSDNASPSGIWSNGATIWVADWEDNYLYAYALADGTRQTGKEFALHTDNTRPTGIWSDGTTIWVSDHDDNRLYAYTLADGTRQTGKEFALYAINTNPQDIWSDGTTIWVADWVDNHLYAYYLDDGKYQGGINTVNRGIRLDRANTSPQGIWSDGETIWVVDSGGGKVVYAYNLADRARRSDRDFTLDDDNGDPRGIWSDGANFWVADNTDAAEKLYAYEPATPALTGLRVSPGTLRPAFRSDVLRYTIPDVPAVSNTITITATAQPGTTVAYQYVDGYGNTLPDAGPDVPGHQVDLYLDENTIRVRATRGSATRTYTVKATVVRTGGVGYEPPDGSPDGPAYFLTDPENALPGGIWSDGNTVRVAHFNSMITWISAYDLPGGERNTRKEFILHADNANAQGIWSNQDTMWVVDTADRRIYAYDVTGAGGRRQTDREFTLHADHHSPRGIWSDGVTVWVTDSEDDKLYAYALDGGARLANRDLSLDSRNADAFDAWSDGTTVWVTDWNDGKVYAYALDGGARQADKEFALNPDHTTPMGIWANADATTFYIADARDKRVYIYKRAIGAPGAVDYAVHGFDLGIQDSVPRGLWSDGTTMWVTDERHDRIFAYSLADGSRQTDKELALDPDNDDPWGIWSDGDIMWVTDSPRWRDAKHKIFAYNLSDGDRKSHLDIELKDIPLADFDLFGVALDDDGYPRDRNNTIKPWPRGLWSDGTTLWVAYRNGDKLYAYTLADGSRDRGRDFSLDAVRDTPVYLDNEERLGIWSDGRTIWVADDADLRLYAYGLGDGERQPKRDLSLRRYDGRPQSLYNSHPTGIWSNGDVLWVADRNDDRIYSYRLPPPVPVLVP